MRFSMVQCCNCTRPSKSSTVKKWMFGESNQSCGNSLVLGARPVNRCASRTLQWPKLGNATMARRPTRSISRSTLRGARDSCKRLAQDHIVEGLIREIGERVLDVAVKDGNAARDGLPHFRAFNLHAARIHALVFGEPGQQLALAAAQIQHASVGLDDVADDGVVAASEQLRDERFGHP